MMHNVLFSLAAISKRNILAGSHHPGKVFFRNLISFLIEGLPSEICPYQIILQHKILCCIAAILALKNNTSLILHY